MLFLLGFILSAAIIACLIALIWAKLEMGE